MVVCGFYKVGQGNIKRRKRLQDTRERRMAIIPFLQAEDDERYVKELKEYVAKEAYIMRDVPGWVPGQSVYNTREFMPRADQRY